MRENKKLIGTQQDIQTKHVYTDNLTRLNCPTRWQKGIEFRFHLVSINMKDIYYKF